MFTEDLSAFFNVTEMATSATLNGVAVTGIYDNEYALQEFGGSASSPSFLMASSAVPATPVGMALVIGATTYKVVETMPDGTGVTMLRLRAGEGAALATVETPVFSPVAGSYGSTQSVTITSATSGASIYYTNDGSAPNATKTLYTGAISVAADVTLKAIAIKAAMTDSAVATAAYVISAAWAPSALFASGEQGAWYDPSDLTTMFQDRAGTTPVTADGQTVGKILDKSGRGNHATAPSDAARPLYKTDGTYSWLQFDGVDDALVTSSFVWGTNKSTACIGILNNQSVGFGLPFAFGPNPVADAGSFGSYVNISAIGDYAVAAKGTTHCYLITAGAAIPSTDVATFTYDLSQTAWADTLKLRLNAVSASLTFGAGGDLGGGNFGTYPLNIGRRGNNDSFLLGNIYSMIIRGALSTTGEITDTETWVNGKTGAF